MRSIIYYLSFPFLAWGCNAYNKDYERKELIKKMIIGFQKNDITELYKMVDSALFNSIYGEDEFIRRINFINNNFKKCDFVLSDSIKNIVINSSKITEYIIPLCSENKSPNQLINNLVISFADYNNKNIVLFFEIRNNLFTKDSIFSKQFNPEAPVRPG
jgi:hypothetical protein